MKFSSRTASAASLATRWKKRPNRRQKKINKTDNMKKHLFIACVLLAFTAAAQTEEGIRFEHGTWKETLARAKKENKLVMLDAFTSWCGPCKWMAKNVFPMKDVGDFYNKNFVSAKIDMEKGEGVDIAKQYNVMNYPTFLYVDGDGKLVHRVCGSREAKLFIEAGQTALNPEKRYATLEKNYLGNKSSAEAALAYFNAASEACMNVEKEVTTFLDAQQPAALLGKNNYQLLIYFINDAASKPFLYLLSNYKEFVAKYEKAEIDAKIQAVYTASIKSAVRAKDDNALAALQKAYRSQANAPAGYLDAFADLTQAKASRDTGLYFKAVINFTDKYQWNDANQLNAAAWDFYEKTDNKAYLLKAEAWAKRSVELDPGYANMDTQAAVLYKLGKYQDAKASAVKAIELGKKDNEDVKETESLLDKINDKLKV
jgi:thiol-disulfide isomerase/thioredoxin